MSLWRLGYYLEDLEHQENALKLNELSTPQVEFLVIANKKLKMCIRQELASIQKVIYN